MKKAICLLLPLLLAISLLGCVAEGNPQNPSVPTQATAASGQPGETPTPGHWESYPVSVWLPEPPGEWSVSGENLSFIDIIVTSRQQAMDYLQQLKDAGFTYRALDSVRQSGNHYSIIYDALNTVTDGITVIYQDIHQDNGSVEYHFYLSFYRNQDVDATTESMKAQEAWDANINRAQVPAPPTDYWNGRTPTDGASGNPVHRVEMSGLSYSDVLNYAQQLKDAGFTVDFRESITSHGHYSYTACNAEGWWIELCRLTNGFQGTEKKAILFISNLMPRYGDWGQDKDADAYLPHPGQSWNITSWTNHGKIVFPNMTYQEALDYIQAISQNIPVIKQQTSDKLGLDFVEKSFRVSENLVQDDGAQTIEYRATFGYYVSGPKNFGVNLILRYDPSNPEAPCTLSYS